MRLLIVEDESIIALDMMNKLTSMGYEVTGIAESYVTALESCLKDLPDLVLMDVNIAGNKDGVETASVIVKTFNLPIIFITAFSNTEIIERIQKANPYGYLLKPFNNQELKTVIEIAYNKYTHERELSELNSTLEQRVEERTIELKKINSHLSNEIDLRNEIERELVSKEKKFRKIVENIASGLIVVDIDGSISEVNKAAANILSADKRKILSLSVKNIFLDKESWGNIVEHITNGDNTPVEVKMKYGKEFYVWVKMIGSFKESKKNNSFILSFIDIDAQKQNEALLLIERKKRIMAIIESEERERKRIAMELHDDLGQRLTAAKLSLGVLTKSDNLVDEDRELLDEAKEMVQETMGEVRKITNNLVPNVLNDFGLEAAINKIIEQIKVGIEIKFNFAADVNFGRLSLSKEVALFRIAQEALNNSVKYSKASVIDIELFKVNGNVLLSIADDGVGFDVEKGLENKSGIYNIQERCSLLHGKLDIKSNNKGTSIKIIINEQN